MATFAFSNINIAIRTKWYFYGYRIVTCDSVGVRKRITSCCVRLKLWVNYVVKLECNMPVKKYHVGLIAVRIPIQCICKHGRVNQLSWHHVCIPLNKHGNGNVLRYISCSCVGRIVILLTEGTSFGNYTFKISKCETSVTVTMCYVTPRKREK
jgi:hypothetical protein